MNMKWFRLKLKYMDRGVLLRKLLSFEDVYVTAVRSFEESDALPLASGREFVPVALRRDFWYADPALFTQKGETWLFMEAFEKTSGLGRIACIRLGEEAKEEPRVVLKEPFHLSFPQVFSWDGEIYMLPETGDDHSIRLYRAIRFPDRWETVARFPTDVSFVDTVILRQERDALTLLSSEMGSERPYYYRYHRFRLLRDEDSGFQLTEDGNFLTTQKFSHAARNAGALYREGKRLILPTQTSTPAEYGVKMVFLSCREDKPDASVPPLGTVCSGDVRVKGLRGRIFGVHSYARSDRYEVIDLKYMEFSPGKLIRRFR